MHMHVQDRGQPQLLYLRNNLALFCMCEVMCLWCTYLLMKVCTCMSASTHVYLCDFEDRSDVYIRCLCLVTPTLKFLRQGLFLNLKLSHLPKLASQWASKLQATHACDQPGIFSVATGYQDTEARGFMIINLLAELSPDTLDPIHNFMNTIYMLLIFSWNIYFLFIFWKTSSFSTATFFFLFHSLKCSKWMGLGVTHWESNLPIEWINSGGRRQRKHYKFGLFATRYSLRFF